MSIMCTIALVLLLDVSHSVDSHEYRMQQEGVAQAFASPQLQQVIQAQPEGLIVSVVHWGSTALTSIGWTLLRNAQDAADFAQRVMHSERQDTGGSTALGNAVNYAMRRLDQLPCEPEQRVIDVSGDGESNTGIDPADMRDLAQAQGITINGLPILSREEPTVDQYYQNQVITADGFVIVAQGFEDFGRAIRRKLTLEIAVR